MASPFDDLSRLSPKSREYMELRNKIALANIGLVFHAAERYRDMPSLREDFVQAGICSLIHAVSLFDPDAGTAFSTYAYPWIISGMKAVLSDVYPVRIDSREIGRMRALEKKLCSKSCGHSNGDRKFIRALARLRAAMAPAVRISASVDPDSWAAISSGIARADPDPTERLDAAEVTKELLGWLVPREKRVLSLRFGLEGKEPLTLAEVAKIIGTKGERVRQIEARAIENTKVFASALGLTDQLNPGLFDSTKTHREKITKYNRLDSKASRSPRRRGKLADR